MAGTMGSYSIASSGMAAMQTALSVTTNNITNVDTDGYTRQSSIQSNTSWTNDYKGVGTGVEVQEIVQIRDKYVDGVGRSCVGCCDFVIVYIPVAGQSRIFIPPTRDDGP